MPIAASDSPAPPVATADEFSLAWESFFRATRRARGRSTGAPLEGSDLTLAQYHLLERLRACEALTVSELAVSAGVAPPTATRMLDGLVRDGIAVRGSAAHDRRAVMISLTSEGRDTVEAAARRVAAARARVRDGLSPAEQEQAAALLRRLTAVVEEQL